MGINSNKTTRFINMPSNHTGPAHWKNKKKIYAVLFFLSVEFCKKYTSSRLLHGHFSWFISFWWCCSCIWCCCWFFAFFLEAGDRDGWNSILSTPTKEDIKKNRRHRLAKWSNWIFQPTTAMWQRRTWVNLITVSCHNFHRHRRMRNKWKIMCDFYVCTLHSQINCHHRMCAWVCACVHVCVHACELAFNILYVSVEQIN